MSFTVVLMSVGLMGSLYDAQQTCSPTGCLLIDAATSLDELSGKVELYESKSLVTPERPPWEIK